MDYLLLMIIVQVVLESIPISSSGHLTLGSCMCAVPAGMTMCKAVYHVLHGPTVIVLLVFFYSYWRLLISWRPFIFFVVLELVTLCGYLLCAPLFSCMPLCIGFCITAFALFSLRLIPASQVKCGWKLKHALIIGAAQALAFIPGVSRFGSTLVAASWCQLPVRDAFAIACLAEIPIALFGCVLE
jgi:undecaprenyl-diphosphatase